eukprot:Platyproteum_vivax@DN10166_c0_g1_i1.p1
MNRLIIKKASKQVVLGYRFFGVLTDTVGRSGEMPMQTAAIRPELQIVDWEDAWKKTLWGKIKQPPLNCGQRIKPDIDWLAPWIFYTIMFVPALIITDIWPIRDSDH